MVIDQSDSLAERSRGGGADNPSRAPADNNEVEPPSGFQTSAPHFKTEVQLTPYFPRAFSTFPRVFCTIPADLFRPAFRYEFRIVSDFTGFLLRPAPLILVQLPLRVVVALYSLTCFSCPIFISIFVAFIALQ